MEGADRRIVALILSHNAPESLRRCLEAIGGQSMPPDAVLVVDNASTPPVEVSSSDGAPPVTVVRSEVNTGPAGGYAQAFEEFLASGYDLAWPLDDDMRPEVHCLERLRTEAAKTPASRVRLPGLAADRRLLWRLAVVVRIPHLAADRRDGRRADEPTCSGGQRTPSTSSRGSPMRDTSGGW